MRSDLGCLASALVPSLLFGGSLLFLAAAGVDWRLAAGGNFYFAGVLLIGPMLAAALWISYRRISREGYTPEGHAAFHLESMSNERVVALWLSLKSDRSASKLPSERVDALRTELLQIAAKRRLTLDDSPPQ